MTAALMLSIAVAVPAVADDAPTVVSPTTNHTATPLGISTEDLLFSWQLDSDARSVVQAAYEVRVSTADEPTSGNVWATGRIEAEQSIGIPYAGPALESQTRYSWQVRVWGDDDQVSAWSEPTWFETGIIEASEWEADWIGGADPADAMQAWDDYTVTLDFTLEPGTAFGVVLRGSDNRNLYMWQFNDELEGQPRLRPHVKVNGGYAVVQPEIDLTSVGLDADVLAQPGTAEITVSGSTIETRLNGTLVDSRSHTAHEAGYVGFRTSASTTANESVMIHQIRVERSNGDVLLETDFADGVNPFSGGEVTGDGLQLIGNHEVAMFQPAEQQPLLRRAFTVDKPVASARIYASARGIYELSLNGDQVGDHKMAPGWTDYRERIQYQSFDVTEQLAEGDNVLGGILAPGWWSGTLAHISDENYGERTSLIAQLRIDYVDGTSDLIVTDDSWRTAGGPWLQADIINGETYDARLEQPGWDLPGFDDSGWGPVWIAPTATEQLTPQLDPPVRETEQMPALERTEPTPGSFVYDLGQNIVGVVSVRMVGKEGQTVTLRFGEEINRDDGTLYTENLRGAKATDHYTFAADGEVVHEPKFTFHGFRYVEISGLEDPPEPEDVVGLVWNSDLDLIGSLSTSSAMLNQLQSNIQWGQRGNFLSIPTDTPARDERMGWSGDINVFAPTASYNMDSLNFLSKWLVDLQDGQQANGDYWGVAPYHPNLACCNGGVGWSDAGITVPWVLWQSYGEVQHIRDGYASMTRFMDYLESVSPTKVRPGGPYNDWLNLDDPTDGSLLATAYYAYDARLMSEMAAAIGEDEDAEHYAQLSEEITEVFVERFIRADGAMTSDSQAAYAVALGMDLVPEERRDQVASRFVATLERHDYHLSTGFLGTPWLVPALSESGHLDVAYRLVMNETYPSWGYEVAMGATTMWERWNSIMPDGSFGDVGMNSFNHYAYGAIGDWMYRTIGGIAMGEPGYKHSVIAPKPGGGLTHAAASYESRFGPIATSWEIDGEDFLLDVTIPANTTATVVLPADTVWAVTEGGAPLADAEGVTLSGVSDGEVRLEVGSGSFSFEVHAGLVAAGDLLDRLADLGVLVEDLHEAHELTNAQRDRLVTAQAAMTDRAGEVLLASGAGGDDAAAMELAGVQDTLAELFDWFASTDLGATPAAQLRTGLLDVRGAAASAVSEVTGVALDARVTSSLVLPGGSLELEVVLTNNTEQPITGVTLEALTPQGWDAVAGDTELGELEPGGSRSVALRVAVPAEAKPGEVADVWAFASFDRDGIRLEASAQAGAEVASPISIGEITTDPAPVGADRFARILVPVTNSGEVPVPVRAGASAPEAWGGELASSQLLVGAGETATLSVAVPIPLTVTEETVAVPVTVQRDDVLLAQGTGSVVVGLDALDPDRVLDHIDLGDAASEQAHNLTAHAASATAPNEAGLTRRYSGIHVPGSWYEFDLAVEPGEPFLLVGLETYDGPQNKEFHVIVDGVEVQFRDIARVETGEGTRFYQVLVDEPDLTADGMVRVRMQKSDTGPERHDPSHADVWSVQLHDDAIAPVVTAAVDAPVVPESGWYREAPVTVTLQAVDNRDAAPAAEYALDGGEWSDYTEPISLSADGVTEVAHRATDAFGNVSEIATIEVAIDQQAPTAAHALSDDRVLTLAAEDEHSGVARIDYSLGAGGDWQAYESPVTVPNDVELVRYRAIDVAGNASEVAEVTLELVPTPTPTPKPSPTVTVTATASPTATATATVTVQPPAGRDLYETSGFHQSSGRSWMTVCEPYSSVVDRCWTYIWGTTVHQSGDRFIQVNGWQFNNLTYVGGSRSDWSSNPLARGGQWTADDGRQWRTECDTASTGRGGCRSNVSASVIERDGNTFRYVAKEVFNNQVRFL